MKECSLLLVSPTLKASCVVSVGHALAGWCCVGDRTPDVKVIPVTLVQKAFPFSLLGGYGRAFAVL